MKRDMSDSTSTVIEYVDELVSWLSDGPPDWSADVAQALRDHMNRAPHLRLLRLRHDDRDAAFLLYEVRRGAFPPYLHYAATDPALLRRGFATRLFEQMSQDVTERPIVASPLTEEGRGAMAKWGFVQRDEEWKLG